MEKELRAYYLTKDKLESLLTDVDLSLEKGHYGQLSIVNEKEEQLRKEKEKEKKDRDEWLAWNTNIHKVKECVDLEKIFERKKEDTKGKGDYKRVLILGRAGIGKSTLCQYIAYRWAKEMEEAKELERLPQKRLWGYRFCAMFWIPLWQLVNYPENRGTTRKDILLWLIQESWHQDKDEELTEDIILEYFKSHRGKILFLLDGFDEVAYLQRESTARGKAVDTLLSEEHWIMTSRPDYLSNDFIKDTDIRRLENIGFNDKQIKQYIRDFFACQYETRPEKAKQEAEYLSYYLELNQNVRGITYIPINLSLICGVWHTQKQGIEFRNKPQTMTEVYQQVVEALLNRHCKRPLKEKSSSISKIEWEEQASLLLTFLKRLGFTALQKRAQIIKADLMNKLFKEICEEIVKEREEKAKKQLSHYTMKAGEYSHAETGGQIFNYAQAIIQFSLEDSKQFKKEREAFFHEIRDAGFLKATSATLYKDEKEKDYYFLHLTFLEYFAACYITEGLGTEPKPNEPDKGERYQTAIECLRQYKYNTDYQIMWQFVAGLTQALYKQGTKRASASFWETFNANDLRDLIGFNEMKLVNQLLVEAECKDDWSDQQKERAKELENYLRKSVEYSLTLPSVPQKIIDKLYSTYIENLKNREIEKELRMRSLFALKELAPCLAREQAGKAFSKCMIILQDEKVTEKIQSAAIDILSKLTSRLTEEQTSKTFFECMTVLQDEKTKVGQRAAIAVLQELTPHLVREQVGKAFSKCMIILQDEKVTEKIQSAAIDILSKLASRLTEEGQVREAFCHCLDLLKACKNKRWALIDTLSKLVSHLTGEQAYGAYSSCMSILETWQGSEYEWMCIGENIVANILSKIVLRLTKAQASEALSHCVIVLESKKTGTVSHRASASLLSSLASHLTESQMNKVFSHCMTVLKNKKASGVDQSAAMSILGGLASHLTESQMSEVYSYCMNFLREMNPRNGAEPQWWKDQKVLSALHKLAPRLTAKQADDIYFPCLALLQDPGVMKFGQRAVADILSRIVPRLSRKRRSGVFPHYLDLLEEEERYEMIRYRGIPTYILTQFTHCLTEEQVNEAFLQCLIALKGMKGGVSQKAAIVALRKLTPFLTPTQAEEVLSVCMVILKNEKAKEVRKGLAVYVLEELRPRLKEKAGKVFPVCIAVLQNNKKAEVSLQTALTALRELILYLTKEQVGEAFFHCLAMLKSEESGKVVPETVLFTLKWLGPSLTKEQVSRAFSQYLAVLKKGKKSGEINPAIAFAVLREFAPYLTKEQADEIFSVLRNRIDNNDFLDNHADFFLNNFSCFYFRKLLSMALKLQHRKTLILILNYAQENDIVFLYKSKSKPVTLLVLKRGNPEERIILSKVDFGILIKILREQAKQYELPISVYDCFKVELPKEKLATSFSSSKKIDAEEENEAKQESPLNNLSSLLRPSQSIGSSSSYSSSSSSFCLNSDISNSCSFSSGSFPSSSSLSPLSFSSSDKEKGMRPSHFKVSPDQDRKGTRTLQQALLSSYSIEKKEAKQAKDFIKEIYKRRKHKREEQTLDLSLPKNVQILAPGDEYDFDNPDEQGDWDDSTPNSGFASSSSPTSHGTAMLGSIAVDNALPSSSILLIPSIPDELRKATFDSKQPYLLNTSPETLPTRERGRQLVTRATQASFGSTSTGDLTSQSTPPLSPLLLRKDFPVQIETGYASAPLSILSLHIVEAEVPSTSASSSSTATLSL